MLATRNRMQKAATVLSGIAKHSDTVRRGAGRIYNDILLKNSPIRTLGSLEYLGRKTKVHLEDFLSVDGNVTLEELVFICALARKKSPRNIVEIGTFDGNTTLQMALNTTGETSIFTLDLPLGLSGSPHVDANDTR